MTTRSLKVFGYYLAFLNYLNTGNPVSTEKIPFLVEIHGRQASKKQRADCITMFMYGFDNLDNSSEQIKEYYQGLIQDLDPKLYLDIRPADEVHAKMTGIFKLCNKGILFEFPPVIRQKTRDSFQLRKKYQSVLVDLIKYCKEL